MSARGGCRAIARSGTTMRTSAGSSTERNRCGSTSAPSSSATRLWASSSRWGSRTCADCAATAAALRTRSTASSSVPIAPATTHATTRAAGVSRRAIRRRTTLAPCPTPEAFLAAWEARNASDEARVRFGGLVHDLECHVDNCLRIVDGVIVGRNGGIKAWIAANLPQLSGKYKTIMRFKALAKRLRQATEIPDPIPTSAVFDGLPPNPIATGSLFFGVANKNYYAVKSQNGVVRMSPGDVRRRLERARTIMRDARREGLGVRQERTDAIREKLGVGGEVGGAGRGEVGGTFAALWAVVERHLE